jgi:pyruvate dehydrogenase E2 component (dihydrolipoamide acetyltransferase)
MAEIVYMPQLSDTMVEGVVAGWFKKVGDKVASGEILAEIETDKATMEFESFYDGVLLYIGVEKGKAVPVNTLLAIIGEEGEDISAIINAAPAQVVAFEQSLADALLPSADPWLVRHCIPHKWFPPPPLLPLLHP